MLGMTRIRRNSFCNSDSIARSGTPAAIETTSLDMSSRSAVSFSTSAMSWGLTA